MDPPPRSGAPSIPETNQDERAARTGEVPRVRQALESIKTR